MESQMMTRSVEDELDATAAQTLGATMMEPAENVEELIEALVSGRGVNVPEPEKFACEYAERPGWRARFNGSERVDPFENPGDGVNVVEADVNNVWRSCGLVVESYCPGSSSTETELLDSFAPTAKRIRKNNHNETEARRTGRVRIPLEALTRNANNNRI